MRDAAHPPTRYRHHVPAVRTIPTPLIRHSGTHVRDCFTCTAPFSPFQISRGPLLRRISVFVTATVSFYTPFESLPVRFTPTVFRHLSQHRTLCLRCTICFVASKFIAVYCARIHSCLSSMPFFRSFSAATAADFVSAWVLGYMGFRNFLVG